MTETPLFTLSGVVVHGKGNGRQVGMPTANLAPYPGAPLPEEGVYITEADIVGERHVGVTNVGLRPTVDREKHITVETYFPDFSADLYGQELHLRFYRYLRPTRPFRTLREVKEQVERDAAEAKAYFSRKEREGC